MLEPKEITIKTQSGEDRTYIISKFPAVAGREIISKYPVSNMPKVGEYQQSEDVMLKLLCYVARVNPDGSQTALVTRALVDNHVPDWETLARIEWAVLEYNTSFFGKGVSSGSLENIVMKAAQLFSKMLTHSSATSSPAGKPPSTN